MYLEFGKQWRILLQAKSRESFDSGPLVCSGLERILFFFKRAPFFLEGLLKG